ncbi:MAG: hypothetical protein ND866_20795 [Pyrinomonadaceae bacterium]|nr:hypothetical protein [Pyrinomonadaceae bacterium]
MLAIYGDGNGSIPRFRNLLPEMVSFETVQFIGTKASGYPSWPGVSDSNKAEYINADQLPSLFRLQLGGGPYIPESRAGSTGRCNTLPV